MIYLLGDVHGQFHHILPALQKTRAQDGVQTVIFLGDIEAQKPFEEEIAPLLDAGVDVWFIPGNHDTDSHTAWANLLPSWHRNLDGRVVTIEGLRIAGLGGVFRGEIWHPDIGKKFNSFADFEASRHFNKTPHLAGRLLKHSSTIWPAVYDAMSLLSADVLVTHEAPSCHHNGFGVLDDLGRAMGIKALFHGHHHKHMNYQAFDDALGFRAHGVGFRGITDVHGGLLLTGKYDEGAGTGSDSAEI